MSDAERLERARMDLNVTAHLTIVGLAMWVAGSWDWVWLGWFVDPAVVIVGKALVAIVGPVSIWNTGRVAYRMRRR